MALLHEMAKDVGDKGAFLYCLLQWTGHVTPVGYFGIFGGDVL